VVLLRLNDSSNSDVVVVPPAVEPAGCVLLVLGWVAWFWFCQGCQTWELEPILAMLMLETPAKGVSRRPASRVPV
jgi:hypothetical protein